VHALAVLYTPVAKCFATTNQAQFLTKAASVRQLETELDFVA
jgi:hypothetical protein